MNQAQQLRDGIQALGLDIDEAKQAKLLDYAALLQKWNKTYNLTALRDPAQTVSHHLLDSLTLLPYIEHAQTMLDVGSRRRTARHTYRHLPPRPRHHPPRCQHQKNRLSATSRHRTRP